MPRAPFQVAVVPYRRMAGATEFAVFRRSDAGYWQVIAGGGEDAETVAEAAQREAREEAAIPTASALFPLATIASVPVTEFCESRHWPSDVYVIPLHYFGVDASGISIAISGEHTEFRWVELEEAQRLLRWQSDAVAVWELSERVQNRQLYAGRLTRRCS